VQARPQLIWETGAWELDAGRRELRRCGAPVPVGFRAFEVFEALVESAGELITKDDLMGRVWPGAIVEDNTLAVHISAIRKALGPDRDMLKTHSRRGYRLLGNWIAREKNAGARSDNRASAQPDPRRPQGNLPAAVSELIGRAAAVRRLTDLLSAYRLVTLTGPGGIGKTRLALEAARLLLPSYANDAFWVELASLSDGSLLAGTIASVLGLEAENALSVESLARAVGNRRLLLVIDNCEHLIDHAAKAAETIIRFCPAVSVLATSRELLQIEGECTYRVPPLDIPALGEEVSAGGAIELFMARMIERRPDVQPDDRLATVAAICRRLDGIPLAIEFAAALADLIGVEQVLSHLDDRFALLTGGRRTALPRHQTLRAALDSSYELLPEQERRVLRRLSIFPAGFTLAAASAVMGDADPGPSATITGIANLVAKSLVVSDDAMPVQRWRLIETIRAYALDKLAGSGEADAVAQRHAEYHRDRLEDAEAE
jgi:non-specific serine/threonine protein kinase